MKRVVPSFKDETDRLFIIGTLVASMFFVFIPSLLLILFAKERMSENSHQIAKDIFNFELLLFLVSLIFMIPVIGWLIGFILGPILIILNIIVMVINLCAISENKETKIPVLYTFM